MSFLPSAGSLPSLPFPGKLFNRVAHLLHFSQVLICIYSSRLAVTSAALVHALHLPTSFPALTWVTLPPSSLFQIPAFLPV